MTLAAAFPGYDPDFFGPGAIPDHRTLLGADDVGAKIGAAAGGTGPAGQFGPLASFLNPSPGGITYVDYAFKCGQGASIYRCYGIGKVSHAHLVDLQHQVNRLAGKRVIAEDGILGPATLNAIKLLGASATLMGLPAFDVPSSLDELAAAAPQLLRQYRAAADQKYGAESLEQQTRGLISSITAAAQATAHEVAQDKKSGQVPAGFTQNAVRASQKAIGDIGARLGAAAASAAAAADQVGQVAGPVGGKSSMKLYIGVGVGLTAVAALTIVLIARSGRKDRRLRHAA